MLRFRLSFTGLLLVVFVLIGACTASKNVTQTQTRLRSVENYRTVDVDVMSNLLKDYRKTEEDAVLYQLESGMLHHFKGNWEESAQHFQEADRAIERLYTKDISKNVKSFLINDLQLPYEGEPYESIYLTTFNCLNYLHMGDMQGALVEMRRINHKLELLNDRTKGLAQSLMKRDTALAAVKEADEKLDGISLLSKDETPPEIQQNSALGRFLTTILYGKTGSPDDAHIELQKLRTSLEDQGQLDFLTALARAGGPPRPPAERQIPSTWAQEEWTASDILSTLFERQYSLVEEMTSQLSSTDRGGTSSVSVPAPSQLTKGRNYNTLLLAFTGQAPMKEERSFHIPIPVNDEIVQLHFAVPILKSPASRVDRVRALAAGDTVSVPMVEDMQTVAHEMFDKRKSIIYTRAVIRAFLKMGAAEGAQKLADEQIGETAGFLAKQAGNLMSSQAAQADTRGWQTMPGHAHALVAKLPEGEHQVTFEYLSNQGHVLKRRTRTVTVQGEGLSLAESIYLK
jgi:hypothetical protein